MEEWKDIPGYKNEYKISNCGRVFSVKKGDVLFPNQKKDYLSVALCKNGHKKRFLIHRLVAEAFIPNPENKPCVDHINTVRFDNRVENLRWVTHSENRNNPITYKKLLGQTRSAETKHKMSESIKRAKKDSGNIWWTNGKQNRCCRERPASTWWRGKTNYNKMEISDVRRKQLAEQCRERLGNPRRIRQKDCRWWTNGEKNIWAKECPAEGFYKGMAKQLAHSQEERDAFSKQMKNFWKVRRFRWTDGINEKLSPECPGDGWYRGRPQSTKDKVSKSVQEFYDGFRN